MSRADWLDPGERPWSPGFARLTRAEAWCQEWTEPRRKPAELWLACQVELWLAGLQRA